MIVLPQDALPAAVAEVAAGRYVEAWARAGGDTRARTYVRYHAGDLEGALREARSAPQDAWLCATGTEIALSLHRGAAAEQLLGDWSVRASAEDAPKLQAARSELAELRATEQAAQAGVRRARWICAAGLALALAALLLLRRGAGR